MLKEYFCQLFESLLNSVPKDVYLFLLYILCIGSIMIIAHFGSNNSWKKLVGLVLIEYVFFILCSTVIFRNDTDAVGYNLLPFWSYFEVCKDAKNDLLAQIIMNVLVYLPVGLLLGMTFGCIKYWQVLLVGVCLSLLVEISQMLFNKGFTEIDDVLNNTLGCLIGYGLYYLFRVGYYKLFNKCAAKL